MVDYFPASCRVTPCAVKAENKNLDVIQLSASHYIVASADATDLDQSRAKRCPICARAGNEVWVTPGTYCPVCRNAMLFNVPIGNRTLVAYLQHRTSIT